MSFWSNFFQFQNFGSPFIDNLLESPNEQTLDKLLEDDDILQETKSQNEKLINFLSKPENLKKLVSYISEEPQFASDQPPDLKRQFKFPFVASEILSIEVRSIYDNILEYSDEANSNNNTILDAIFAYFTKEEPLNTTLSSYVSKLAGVLLKYNPPKILGYMKEKKEIIGNILKHLGNANVMEFLVKIITISTDPNGNNGFGGGQFVIDESILQWLNESEIIPTLISKYSPANNITVHENVSQVLVDIIMVLNSATSTPVSPIIEKLESEPIMNQLFGYMFESSSSSTSSVIEFGLKVLIGLLERHILAAYDTDTTIENLPVFLKSLCGHLDILHTKLTEIKSPKKVLLSLPIGEISAVGSERLKIVEFFAVLSQSNYHSINSLLVSKGIFASCIKMFFDHPWNNFLHSTVEWLIQGILARDMENLKLHVLKDCKLIDYIIEASRLSAEDYKTPKGAKRGYMGHITSICIAILSNAGTSASIDAYLNEHKEWNTYVKETLQPTLEIEGRDFLSRNSTTEQPVLEGAEYNDVEEFENEQDSQNTSIEEQFDQLEKELTSDMQGVTQETPQENISSSTEEKPAEPSPEPTSEQAPVETKTPEEGNSAQTQDAQ